MTIISYTPNHGQTFKIPADECARLEAMTDAEIAAGALTDPDNPPVKATRLQRMAVGREARLLKDLSTIDTKNRNGTD
jgi:hypothetical protein